MLLGIKLLQLKNEGFSYVLYMNYIFFSIFDKDDDGFISVEELRNIMKNLGDKMSDEELDEMIDLADPNHEGLVNYLGMSSNIICM